MRSSPNLSAVATVWLGLCVASPVFLTGCGPPHDESPALRVAAAASLQPVAQELALAFRAQHDIQVRINCAGSNVLAKQIKAAGRADVFLSADQEWTAYLSQKNCLWENSQSTFLSNRLVIVAHPTRAGGPQSLDRLLDLEFDYLAMGNPEGVPAGRYAKRLLETLPHPEGSLWSALQTRIAPCLDVRAALAMARSHPGVLALVYSSEAFRSPGVQRFIEIPESLQPEILYSAVLVRTASHPNEPSEAARSFLDFLSSREARAIYRSHGFTPIPHTTQAAR